MIVHDRHKLTLVNVSEYGPLQALFITVPGQLPSRNTAPRIIALRAIAPEENFPLDNCPLDNCPR